MVQKRVKSSMCPIPVDTRSAYHGCARYLIDRVGLLLREVTNVNRPPPRRPRDQGLTPGVERGLQYSSWSCLCQVGDARRTARKPGARCLRTTTLHGRRTHDRSACVTFLNSRNLGPEIRACPRREQGGFSPPSSAEGAPCHWRPPHAEPRLHRHYSGSDPGAWRSASDWDKSLVHRAT